MIVEPLRLIPFVTESNRIEGIARKPHKHELLAHQALLAQDSLSAMEIELFVSLIQPGAILRNARGLNVRVGDHIPPPGGPEIEALLEELLRVVNTGVDPFEAHVRYETLHPFMDGNGRSGRAVWLWQMLNQKSAFHALNMGFLHLFYYQTLSAWRP